VPAIDLALDVLKRLREKGITAEQLASAKAYLKGNFPRDRLETAEQLAGVLSEIELHELNRGEIDDLFSRIDAVTVENANEVARRWWSADNLQFCVLGNAARIREGLAKYAPVRKEIAITDPGFAAPAF
jgi:predicted Zn-dependent peptidase